MQIDKRYWEVPEVDLNLKHYSGHPSDVIKKVKRNIEKYLRTGSPSLEQRSIYSAVYNSLDFYKNILYSSASDFSTGPTFLNHSLTNMKVDYEYLCQKYNSDDLTVPPVITINGRIKSPVSAIEKVKDKIEEYLENKSDLRYLNESLRDFMGVRIIVDPPQEIKDKGEDAEREFLQEVLEDLLEFRGISKKHTENSYDFIPVNTKNNPDKLEQIKSDGKTDHLPSNIAPFVKNYVDHPKKSHYQSYHICATPPYAAEVPELPIPNSIIPPAKVDYSFEYQIRTKKMNDMAEHGKASHDDYKALGEYHRLAIPFYIEYNQDQNKFKTLNLEESCRKHFGYVPFLRIYSNSGMYISDMTLSSFRDLFTSTERDATIDGKKRIIFSINDGIELKDEPTSLAVLPTQRNLYILEDAPAPVFLTMQELASMQSNPVELQEILEKSGVTNSIIPTSEESDGKPQKPSISVYSVETPEDRRVAKENNKLKNKEHTENISGDAQTQERAVADDDDVPLK